MKRLFVTLMAAMVAVFVASPASAQATRTWVSGVGDDVNPCSRTAPCKTFAGAISKTATGGMINCLDPGGFGTLTITKSITIDCAGTFGSTLNSGGINGFVVNNSATATPGTVKVVLNGLEINGAGTTMGLNGVRIISGRDVLISNTNIRNQSGAGIAVNGGTQTRVTIDHVSIFNTDIGISVAPSGAASNKVKISNTLVATSTTAARLRRTLRTGRRCRRASRCCRRRRRCRPGCRRPRHSLPRAREREQPGAGKCASPRRQVNTPGRFLQALSRASTLLPGTRRQGPGRGAGRAPGTRPRSAAFVNPVTQGACQDDARLSATSPRGSGRPRGSTARGVDAGAAVGATRKIPTG